MFPVQLCRLVSAKMNGEILVTGHRVERKVVVGVVGRACPVS